MYQRYGDLGVVDVDPDGQMTLRIESLRVKVYDIIGRSIIVHRIGKDNGDTMR